MKLGRLPIKPRMRGFDGFAISWFNLKDKLATSGLGRRSPLWNTLKASEHLPHDGLWLVEPHAGKDGVGAKNNLGFSPDSVKPWTVVAKQSLWIQVCAGTTVPK